MTDIRNRVVLLTIGILLTCCCCLVIPRTYTELRIRGVRQAASRIGSEPTMEGIAEHIRGTVKIGMSRHAVEQALGSIAPIKVASRGSLNNLGSVSRPTACDELWLMLTPLPGHEWRISACYDEQDKLVYMESYEADDPALNIWRPEQ